MTRRPAAARYGIVNQAALDLRRGPDHRQELRSQLLLGETVEILRARRDGGWLEVRGLLDGYRGWARSWGVLPTSRAGLTRWRTAARARVTALFAEARSLPGAGWLVTPLFWESRVIPGRRRGAFRSVRLPDGRSAWVLASVLEGTRKPTLERRVQELQGVPYLWGGRTPAGLDCSAFAQLLLAEQGVSLPRDTAEQIGSASPLAKRSTPRAGDLIFFRARTGRVGHVGVALKDGYFAHCRGTVRINTLDASNPLYDSDLDGTRTGWFRPRKRVAKRGRVAHR